MKVIMLSGYGSSGKTTTLNMVYDELIRLGATVVRPKSGLGTDPKDFECVLNYRHKNVAIFTMGDYYIETIHAMSYYEGMSCDVLIVANSNKATAFNRLRRYPVNIPLSRTMPRTTANEIMDRNTIIRSI